MNITLNNGEKMPILGLGTWNSAPGEVEAAVKSAIDAGYRHIDCAHCYENEAEVGKAIADKISESVVKREDLFVTSKLWNTHHRAEHVEIGLDHTLKNLGLDYLDLYLIHWPFGFEHVDETTIFPGSGIGTPNWKITMDESADYVETWKSLEKIHQSTNKLKSIGVSNFNQFQINRILRETEIVPAINQVEVHAYFQQKELVKFCESKQIKVTAYSPLGSPGRPEFMKASDEPLLMEVPEVLEMGKKYGKSAAQVLLRWLTQRGIVAIPKSVTASRIAQNIDIFNFELNCDEMKVISEFTVNYRICNPLIFMSKFYPFLDDYSE